MEQRCPAVAGVAGVHVGAGVDERGHGVEGAGSRGPHQRRDAVLVGLVGRVPCRDQAAQGVGVVPGGGGAERGRGWSCAGGASHQRGAEAEKQHEAVHGPSCGVSYTENFAL
jgi:hypothetical protein